ncbi:MAG: transposase family protein [Chthoniobacteraceae bacterium]
MKEPEFCVHLLGLKTPWTVEAVKLDTGSKSVEVKVSYEAGTVWASEAGERLPVDDHVERSWRHLDTCGFETRLVCRVPRVRGWAAAKTARGD